MVLTPDSAWFLILLVSFLVYSSTLKMEEICFSETRGSFQLHGVAIQKSVPLNPKRNFTSSFFSIQGARGSVVG
jgi:hypothetical protein